MASEPADADQSTGPNIAPRSSSLCGRCGSVRTTVVEGSFLMRIVAVFLGETLICDRCGWIGRPPRRPSRRRARSRRSRPAPGVTSVGQSELDLEALDAVVSRAVDSRQRET